MNSPGRTGSSTPASGSRYDRFLTLYPQYRKTSVVDRLRETEYARLDAAGHTYLDYTGGSLYAESQVRGHIELLCSSTFGNPHSSNPTSTAMTELVERTRRHVLSYFNASPSEYTAVFTPNATGALKLVGESYPFTSGGRYLLTADNHNSVNGIRRFASGRGAGVEYVPLTTPDLRIEREALSACLKDRDPEKANLLAFPAQSNFTGVKHPLEIVDQAQSLGWDVVLDAAAYVPTSRLDLTAVRPDFVSVSFYKMFGYPTGVGCLIAKKSALARLQRPWYAGGTVNFATVRGLIHLLAPNEAGFEDGTLNYLAIPAVELGLRHIARTGIETIGERVRCLTGWLLENLIAMAHSNGRHMVRIYGPASNEMRGGTVTLNFYDPDGHLLDYRRIEELAGEQGISLRTGCFCNPGAGEIAEGLTEEDMREGLRAGPELTLPRFLQVIQHRGSKGAGAIRVSLGLASNFADVEKFLGFAESFIDQTRLSIGQVTFDVESCRVIRDGA